MHCFVNQYFEVWDFHGVKSLRFSRLWHRVVWYMSIKLRSTIHTPPPSSTLTTDAVACAETMVPTQPPGNRTATPRYQDECNVYGCRTEPFYFGTRSPKVAHSVPDLRISWRWLRAKWAVFLDVTLCSLLDIYQLFGEMYCVYLQGRMSDTSSTLKTEAICSS